MNRAPHSPELTRFRELIASRIGLACDGARAERLSEVLERRARVRLRAVPSYLDMLERPHRSDSDTELSDLAVELTVGETYFLRHAEQLRAYVDGGLRERAARGGPVRVLSAGCASGEEAYTLAILAKEHGFDHVEVHAFDLNPVALRRAREARYSEWSLRDTPTELRERYFDPEGPRYALRREQLPPVRFERKNLVDPSSLAPGSFDIVFCRNVLMYFTRAQAELVVRRLAAALLPGGYLFLGYAESLRGFDHELELCQSHGAFYYRKPDELGEARSSDTRAPDTRAEWNAADWFIAVERSSRRVLELSSDSSEHRRTPATGIAKTEGGSRLGEVLEHVEHERFDAALEALDRITPTERGEDVGVLRALLLMQLGRLIQAEEACAELLEQDERDASVHYLLALVGERRGQLRRAIEHAEIASRLDPSFSMPQLHLGILAARMGDARGARAALETAAGLLEREDPLRLLLFGGGFQRSGLIRLCRAEMVRLGGAE